MYPGIVEVCGAQAFDGGYGRPGRINISCNRSLYSVRLKPGW